MKRYLRFLPNIVTLCAMACGACSIVVALHAAWVPAAVAILTACLLDVLDGWLARLLAATSRLGTVLDSVSDFVSFGIAPAVLLYARELRSFGAAGLIVCALLAVCAGLRLVRYAAQADSVQKTEFVGLPTTAAAMFVASGILLSNRHFADGAGARWWWMALGCLLGVLMVGRIRYGSAKGLLDRYSLAKMLLPVIVLAALLNLNALVVVVFLVSVAYVLSGPLQKLGTLMAEVGERGSGRVA